MDEKSILLMSEELRAALGEKTKAAVEGDVLPGRWSRSMTPDAPGPSEIHIAGRVTRCAVTKSGSIRVIAQLLDDTLPTDLVTLVDRAVPVLINVGCGSHHVIVSGRVISVRIDGGAPTKVSILISPAA
jgi:hypothetical protein